MSLINTTILIYIGFFIGVFAFSIIINKVLLKFSLNLGIRNQGEIVRWASTSKPSLGGISFFIAFLFSASFATVVLKNQISADIQSLGILSSVTLGFLMGLGDDAYNTRPWLKFTTQVICALILILTGTYIQFFPWLLANYLLTILWVVGIMNSINMLDNMDGITTIASIFITFIGLIIIHFMDIIPNIHFILMIGVLASLIGFLYYNWNPSKMYMGDTGSQFLGVLLAAIAIIYFWNFKLPAHEVVKSKQLVITLLAFVIPISDTTTVTINRLMKGKSPFVGGKDHTTHHLSYLGLSDRQIAVIYATICLISTLLIILILYFIPEWSLVHTFIFSSYFLVIFLALFINTKISKPSDKFKRGRMVVLEKNEVLSEDLIS